MGRKGKGATRVLSGSSSGGMGGGTLQDRILQQRVEAYREVLHTALLSRSKAQVDESSIYISVSSTCKLESFTSQFVRR